MKLLPCPFCGLTTEDTVSSDMCPLPAIALAEYPFKAIRVECEGCGAKGPLMNTKKCAVKSWNSRNEKLRDAEPLTGASATDSKHED
jgi:Lar family restriction alleviation protein